MTAWLVLPTYDEAENIEAIVRAALDVLERAAPDEHRILVVDDGSPDGTGEIADRLAAELPAVEVLHRAAREGLGPAYLAGFAHALAGGASFVLEMDADFSHNPTDLARLLAAARSADVVIGSRYVAGGGVSDWGRLRRLVSRGGSWYARTVLGSHVRDLTGGFKCIRRGVLEAIDLPTVRSRGYAFQVELTNRATLAGFSVVELPIVFRDRQRGSSKMSPRIAIEAAVLVPRLRMDAHRALARSACQRPATPLEGDESRAVGGTKLLHRGPPNEPPATAENAPGLPRWLSPRLGKSSRQDWAPRRPRDE